MLAAPGSVIFEGELRWSCIRFSRGKLSHSAPRHGIDKNARYRSNRDLRSRPFSAFGPAHPCALRSPARAAYPASTPSSRPHRCRPLKVYGNETFLIHTFPHLHIRSFTHLCQRSESPAARGQKREGGLLTGGVPHKQKPCPFAPNKYRGRYLSGSDVKPIPPAK